jgi:hypothetical protein
MNPTMYVYGIHCDLSVIQLIPLVAAADYYMDYGIMVFPQYTTAVHLTSRGQPATPHFWEQVRIVAKNRVMPVSREDPYITDEEEEMVRAIRELCPWSDLQWYYVPTTYQGSKLLSLYD